MKIALYKWASTYISPHEASDYNENDLSQVRVSEIVEVEFPMLTPDAVIPKELAQLDEMERKLTEEHTKKLAVIQDKRKELQSISGPQP